MKIGLLIPLQGASGLWGPSCEACARLAARELNAGNGILGSPVELLLIDSGASRPLIAQALRAAAQHGPLAALVGMHTSDLRMLVKASIPQDMPYVYTPLYEGNETADNVFAIGETPERLLAPGIAWLTEQRGARRWFLVGNDYVWPRKMHSVASRLIARHGGATLGEAYVPLGSTEFEAVLQAVRRAMPDVVVTSVIGEDAVRFHRAFAEAGLATRILRLATAVDENVLYGVGADRTENMFLSAGYFANLRSTANDGFRERYHTAFGEAPPMQNDIAQSCYEGLHYLAELTHHARSLSAGAMRKSITAMRLHRSARLSPQEGMRRPIYVAGVDGFDPFVVATA